MLTQTAFQAVFDLSPIGEALYSPDTDPVILAVNQAFLRATGRVRDDLVGKKVFEVFGTDPNDHGDSGQPALRHSLAEVLATGKPHTLPLQRYPIQVTGPDGADHFEERYWRAVNTPVFDADGQLLCISHRTEDITVHARLEDAMRRHTERQAFQLEVSDKIRELSDPDAIIGTAIDLLGRHFGLSRVQYAEIDDPNSTFYVPQDWTNHGLSSIAREVMPLDVYGAEIIATLRAGKPMIVHDVHTDPRTAAHAAAYDAIGVRANLALPLIKDGKLVTILSLHQSTPRTWTEQEIAMASDLGERTWAACDSARAQAALRMERDQSQHIFDNMNEGFALVDRDWNVRQFNAKGSQITRRKREDVIGRNLWAVTPELVGTPVEACYRRVQQSGVGETLEFEHHFADADSACIEVKLIPTMDGGLAIFFRDITPHKRSERQLKEENRRKDEFLAMLAHELRNPLAPISAAASLMEMAPLDSARVHQASQVISRQVNHMTGLIDDLLDMSRVARGLVAVSKTPQDIKSVVANAVEQVRPIMEKQQHHLSIELAAEPAFVMGDQKRLVQILTNLLNNAAKYTPLGGDITLRLACTAGTVLLSVADNGIGIEPELQGRVFELFEQAERSPDRAQGGLGLGLALVKHLVELHGGAVSCHSDGLGEGSVFTVNLPRLVEEPHHRADAPAKVENAASPKRLRVLVVDDNVDAADMLNMLLGAMGHEVQVAHEAQTALDLAHHDVPDVGLFDIGLPDVDGNELARRFRADPATSDSILIALTGYGQEEDKRAARAAGFDHYLVKPVDTDQLIGLLGRVSPGSHARPA